MFEIFIDLQHGRFTDPGIVVNKKVGFGFDVSDGSTVARFASFGASGAPLRPWMTFHIFGSSEFDIAS